MDTIKKLPLEERISRIRTGRSFSPQFTEMIIEQVCNAPVIDHLRRIDSPDAAYRIRIDSIINYHRDPESMTFGDLAVMVTHWYMGEERNCPDNILVYIEAFLTALFKEYKVCSSYNERHNRRTMNHVFSMAPMQKLLFLAIGDYEQYIVGSGLPLRNKEWVLGYIYQNRLLKNETLVTICSHYLNSIEKDPDEFINKLRYYPFGPLIYRNKPEIIRLEPMINFFIVPLADYAIRHEYGQENNNERKI